MSSTIRTKITIDVKNGDVFDEMRLEKQNGEKGRSNTGTYFLCSMKNYDFFKPYFDTCENYYIDLDRVRDYQILFKEYQFKNRDKYSDHMDSFDSYCEEILDSISNSILKPTMRINDTRCFFRFADNTEYIVRAFRHILYGEITSLVLEFDGNKCFIYPEVKQNIA